MFYCGINHAGRRQLSDVRAHTHMWTQSSRGKAFERGGVKVFASSKLIRFTLAAREREGCLKCISTFAGLNYVLPVAGTLVNTSRSVRDRRNSIREIHGPVQRPLSEIDGLRRRLRRGQLPWYSVLSPSCCQSCLGSTTPGCAGRAGGERNGRLKAPLHPGP